MKQKIWKVIRNGKIVNVTFPDEEPLYVFGAITTQAIDEGGAVFTVERTLDEVKIYKENELDWFKLYQPEGEEK